jgi:hypothetical protein
MPRVKAPGGAVGACQMVCVRGRPYRSDHDDRCELGVAVDHRGEVDEPGSGVDVGDVADELDPGRSAVKSRPTRSGISAAASASASVVTRTVLADTRPTLVTHDLAHQLG